MTKYTPRGYPVPDDYQQPADVPAALDALADSIDADVAAVESRQVVAGNGLTGGGTGEADRTLNVGAGDGITVGADTVAINPARVSTTDHNHDTRYPRISYQSATPGTPGFGVLVHNFGSLAPGEEKEYNFTVPAGSFIFVSVQHPSTYIFASGNLVSDTGANVRIRNSTTQTPHNEVKVHILIVKA